MSARLGVVRGVVKVFCHPVRHVDEVFDRIDWDSGEASAVIALIAAQVHVHAQLARQNISYGSRCKGNMKSKDP